MGQFLGKAPAAASAAVKAMPTKFTAAPNAEAYVKAAKAASAAADFPGMPQVPSSQVPSGSRPPLPPEMEMQANRGIVEMLNKSSIITRSTSTAGAGGSIEGVESVADASEAAPGISVSDLMAALVLHAQNPEKWTADALARKYQVADEASFASALQHVQPYKVVEDPNEGRFVGIPVRVAAEDARLDDAEKRAREHKRLFDSTKPQPQSAGSSAALPE